MAQTRIRPFLTFEDTAEEAMTFYVALFPESDITETARYGPGEVDIEG